jgi:hypothetical protein
MLKNVVPIEPLSYEGVILSRKHIKQVNHINLDIGDESKFVYDAIQVPD